MKRTPLTAAEKSKFLAAVNALPNKDRSLEVTRSSFTRALTAAEIADCAVYTEAFVALRKSLGISLGAGGVWYRTSK